MSQTRPELRPVCRGVLYSLNRNDAMGGVAPALSWSVAGASQIAEGAAGTYTVSYSNAVLAPGQTASVVVTAGGQFDATLTDAISATDYSALATTLTFTGGGVTQQTLAVTAIDDTIAEEAEDFQVALSGQTMGSLAVGAVDVTIPASDNYVCDAADFDGTNDYAARGADLTGAVDGKEGSAVISFRKDGGDGASRMFLRNAGTGAASVLRFSINLEAGNTFTVGAQNAADTEILRLNSTATYTVSSAWKTVLVSWNLATGAAHMYEFDTNILAGSPTLTNDNIDYIGGTDFAIGAAVGGNNKWNGALAEIWFDDSYIDFSVEANRRKFISATGRPVDLGSDGSLPTGSAPLIYLHLDDGEAANNFVTNAGTGGGFTLTGSLDTASSSPTD